jgi:hypothetical protein
VLITNMSQHHNPLDVGDDDVFAALTLLARPRTSIAALPLPGSGAMHASLLRIHETGCETVGSIGIATATTLRNRAWIARGTGESWRITRTGLEALRRRRSDADTQFATPYSGRSNTSHGTGARPQVNDAESPLAWLRHRKGRDGAPLISEAQFLAGEQLRNDFTKAQMMPRITASCSDTTPNRHQRRSAPGTGVDLADSVIAAKDRVHRALVAVGPELADMLIDVCCHLKGLEEAERLANLPQRSGKVLLLTALSVLARHYGLVRPAAVERQIATRIRAWTDGHSRPNLESWRDT